jgi:hypothetical protein
MAHYTEFLKLLTALNIKQCVLAVILRWTDSMELYTRATRNGEKIDINRCRRISISSKRCPLPLK